jgi:hypothetical protein
MKYQVIVCYRGTETYVVEAESADKAHEKAKQRYHDGEKAELSSNDHEEVYNTIAEEME